MKKLVLVALLSLALLVTASVAMAAKPASQVRGQGTVQITGAGTSVSHIAVNAWLDGNGVPHGMVQWTGGVPAGTKPTPDPWHTAVTSIDFTGNTVEVCFVVVHSVIPSEIGLTDCLTFTDNAATGTPDTIDHGHGPVPIQAGNITVG